MTPLQYLEFDISNRILEIVDMEEDRGDVEGATMALAKQIMGNVAQFINTHDYDLEDLL